MGDASDFFLTIFDIFDREIKSINETVNKIKNTHGKNNENLNENFNGNRNSSEYNKNNPICNFSSFFPFQCFKQIESKLSRISSTNSH